MEAGPWGALAGALMGLVKAKNDTKKDEQHKQVEATKEMWSQFTGEHGNYDPRGAPDAMGSAMQGAAGGYGMGQNVDDANAYNNYLDKESAAMDRENRNGGAPGMMEDDAAGRSAQNSSRMHRRQYGRPDGYGTSRGYGR